MNLQLSQDQTQEEENKAPEVKESDDKISVPEEKGDGYFKNYQEFLVNLA